jgi:ferredoxin
MKRYRLPLIPRPGTRAFAREARRASNYSLFDFLHGYVYGRWIYTYIGIGLNQHPLARIVRPLVGWLGGRFPARSDDGREPLTFADTYHGKVVPLEAAKQLVTVQEDVDLGDLEQTIPYATARDIVLQDPDHIVVVDCACRSVRPDPCGPLDVCLVIGEPFASFVAEHHPRRSRWISQEEAVAILQDEQERGHVHHAFFKDAMFGRFYAICNCCSCCCAAMGAWNRGSPMLASSGHIAVVDEDLCAACGLCADHCQFEAISVDNGCAVVDEAACMGCGVCVAKCTQEALSLVRDPSRGEPLEIRELIAAADAAASRTA